MAIYSKQIYFNVAKKIEVGEIETFDDLPKNIEFKRVFVHLKNDYKLDLILIILKNRFKIVKIGGAIHFYDKLNKKWEKITSGAYIKYLKGKVPLNLFARIPKYLHETTVNIKINKIVDIFNNLFDDKNALGFFFSKGNLYKLTPFGITKEDDKYTSKILHYQDLNFDLDKFNLYFKNNLLFQNSDAFKYLHSLDPDSHMVEVFGCIIAQFVLFKIKFPKVLIINGKTNNGKTVLMNVLHALSPTTVKKNVNLVLIASTQSKNQTTMFENRNSIIVEEDIHLLNSKFRDGLKEFTGRQFVVKTFDVKHKTPKEILIPQNYSFISNYKLHLPNEGEGVFAIARRFIFIEMVINFGIKKNQIVDIDRLILDDLFLNDLLTICLVFFIKYNGEIPITKKMQLLSYNRTRDVVLKFVDNLFEGSKAKEISYLSGPIYEQFKGYCRIQSKGPKIIGFDTFIDRLLNLIESTNDYTINISNAPEGQLMASYQKNEKVINIQKLK